MNIRSSNSAFLSYTLALAGLTALLSGQTAQAQPQLTGTLSAPSYASGVYSVTLTLTNSGSEAANNVSLNSITTRILTGSGSMTESLPSLPASAGSLASGATTTVPIQMSVTLPVSRFSLIEAGTVQDASNNSFTFSISQLAVMPTSLTIGMSPGSLTFANQTQGTTSSAENLTISNTGDSTVSLAGFNLTGANASDFAISSNSCTPSLSANASCRVGITFTPSATGLRNAALSISGNFSASPASAALSGTGTAAPTFTLGFNPGSLTFAAQNTGTTSAAQSVMVSNTGNSAVTFSSIGLTGANPGDFSISNDTCPVGAVSLAAGASCSVSITFSPSAVGARVTAITFSDNASGSPQSIGVSGTGQSGPPALTFSPSSLTFALQNTGTTSVAQSVTVTNTSNNPAAFSSISLGGANPSDFSISSDTCPVGAGSVGGGASCSVSIKFSPTASGSRTAAILFTDNTTGSPQSVNLSGTGQLSTFTLSFSPSSLTYAVQNTGTTSAAQSVTVSNTGNSAVALSSIALTGANPGDFAISNSTCPASIAASSSCAVSITFSPTANGSRTAAVTFTDNATGSPQSVGLSGTGQVPTFTLSFSPSSLTYALQNTGTTSAAQSVTVSNTGNSAVTLSSIALTGANAGDYSISNNTCPASLAASSSCSVSLTFSPTANGSRIAALTFTDNAIGSPQSVGLSGTGQVPTHTLQFSPSSLTYALQNTGTTSGAQAVTVTNIGNSTVTLSSIALTGANFGDFSISNNTCPASLAANASCSVSITFSPTAAGSRTASVTFTDNATGSPQSVGLSGTGQVPSFTLNFSPSSLTFALQNTGSTSTAQSVTVTNNGNSPVTFSSIALTGANSGDFAISNNSCPVGAGSLAATSSCSVSVTFSPSANGSRIAAITFTDNASGSPQSVGLTGTGQVPTYTLNLNPGSLTFALQNTGTTSAAQAVTITNNGNSAVTFSSIALTGANPGDYSISADTCPVGSGNLAANSSCSLSVKFSPTANGTRTAAVTFTDNANGSPQSIGLTGTGQVPTVTLGANPGSLTFSSQITQTTSAAQGVTITSNGNSPATFSSIALTGANPGDFAISSDTCPVGAGSLAANASCSVSVTFTPTAAGARTASITFTDNANGSPQTIALSGTGTAPTISLGANPGSLTFSSQIDGTTSAAQGVTITNNGNAAATFSSIALTGANPGDFSISSDTCPVGSGNLAVNASCSVSVKFTPTAAGARTASITFTDNANGSPQTIPLSGTGTAPTYTLNLNPGSLTYALQNTGTTSGAQSVTVTNTGNSPVTFSSIALTGANAGDYSITADTCPVTSNSLAASASCAVSVTFSPTAAGTRTAAITFTDNATGSPQSVGITGTAQIPTYTLSFSPSSLSFATQNTGSTSAAQGVTISNTGNSPVTFTSWTLGGANPGDFAIASNTCPNNPATLSAGGSCVITVAFSPAAAGSRSASISVADNATGSPQSIGLSGTGQTPTFTLSFIPSSLTFTAQNTGTTSSAQGVTISNTGNNRIAFTSFVLGGANAADFAIASNNCPNSPTTLAVGSYCSLTVTFSPSAAGARTASIAVTDNATNSPQSIGLTGTGQTPVTSISFSPSPLNFNTVNTGSSSPSNITVSNTGNTPVSFTSFAIAGANAADFSITSNNCPSSPATLAVGTGCSVQVTFAPQANGARAANLIVTDNANGSPQSVGLSGTGQTLTYTLTFSPSSLTFAAQNQHTTSTAQGVTISSTGNSPVTFSGFSLTGANAADFSIASNTCPSSPATLAANSSCSISVTFTPSTQTSESASISVTDNATGSPQSIALSGTGQSSSMTLTISPSSVTFSAPVTVNNPSSAQGFNITNTGTAAVTFTGIAVTGTNASDFAITSNNCPSSPQTLAAGSGCSIAVTFTPSATGARSAAVTLTDNAGGSPQSVALTGTGQAPATTITLSPSAINFPTTLNVGTSSNQVYTYITNTGTSPVQFSSFALAGADPGDFKITENTCPMGQATMAANAACYVYVTFTPTAAGTRTATLIVTDNATGTPQSVNITGTGQTPTMMLSFSPSSITFSNPTPVGTTASQTYTYVQSTGNNPVTISSIQITGANATDFAFTNSTGCGLTNYTLSANGACYVYVNFTPGAAGSRTAMLTFTDNATGSPQTVTISGTGVSNSQTLSFSSSPIAFSATSVGSTNSQYWYISNAGNTPVNFSSFVIGGATAGDFSINPTYTSCSTTTPLNGGAQCNVYLSFTPSATGGRNANIQITDNASGSPQTVNMSGVGTSSTQFVVTPASLTFNATNIGSTSAGLNVTVYNTTNAAISFASAALSGANAGDYAISNNTCGSSVAANGNCVVTITFTPSAAGSRTATLTLTDGATTSPQTVSITGTGQASTQVLQLYSNFIAFGNQVVNTTSAANYAEPINKGTGGIMIAGASISGANASDFAISSDNCPTPPAVLASGSGCEIYVTFTPTAIGNRTATLTISGNAQNSPQTVTLTGTGLASTNQLQFYSPFIAFGQQIVGTTASPTYTEPVNKGNSPLTISSVTLSGANASDFTITSDNCVGAANAAGTLAAGNGCFVYVSFTPSAVGARSAMLTFTDTSNGSPQSVPLTGMGVSNTSQLSLSDNTVPFGSVLLGATSSASYFYIYNVGNTPITLNSFTLTGPNAADFSIAQNECSLSPQTLGAGSGCYVYLIFTPSVVGAESASLQIADSVSGSPQSVQLTGIGVSNTNSINLQDTAIAFGSLNVGTSTAGTANYFYMYNVGSTPVTIGSITITGVNSGDFTLGTTTCPSAPSTLAAGSNCYVYVIFTPSAVGPRSATVQITDSAPDSPQSVSLEGIGSPVVTMVSLQDSSVTFPAANLGTVSAANQYYFYIINKGSTPVTFTSAFTIQGANAADFSIASTSCPTGSGTLGVGDSCLTYVSFTPSVVGPETAYIQVSDNALGSPQIVNLSGLGQTATELLRLSPTSLEFATQAVGTTSSAKNVNLYNQGTAPASFTSYTLTGGNSGDFAITSNGCPSGTTTLAVGSTCNLSLTFTPTATGQRTTTLQITDSASGSPQSVPIVGSAGVPEFYSTVSQLVYGPQTDGVSSSPGAFSIYNEGASAMNLSGITLTGANASDFTITLNNCGSSIAVNGGCTVEVTFTPSTVGVESAAVQVTDNAPGSPHIINLSGIGQAATSNALLLTATDITFNPQVVNTTSNNGAVSIYNEGTAAITFTGITITGPNASDFGITFNNCGSSLAPNGSGCTVEAAFTPTAAGTRTASIQIASSANGSPQTVSLFGTALPATEQALLSRSTIAFSAQNVGTTSSAAAVSIYNEGDSPITFAASNPFTITGANSGDFNISFNNCGSTLAANGSGCTVEVTFRPSAVGTRTATLQIADDAPGSPQTVNLMGFGEPVTATMLLTETALSLGVQTVGTTSTNHSVSLYDEGTGAITFAGSNAFTITGPNASDFAITFNNCSTSLTGGGGACTLDVAFTPSIVGLETATLNIADSAPDSPETVTLFGTGAASTQVFGFEYSSLTFAPINVGTTSPVQTNYIYNEGTSPISLTGFTITGGNAGDFSISNNQCPSSLAAGSQCYVQIAFTPTAVGPRSSTLQVTDSAPGSPQTLSLFGTGQTPVQTLGLEYSALVFGTQTVGTTSGVMTNYIYNNGNAAISFSSFNITGTNASEFTISTNECGSSLAAGSYCYVQLTFTPAGTGQRVANLQITDTATGSPQVMNLFGTGQ